MKVIEEWVDGRRGEKKEDEKLDVSLEEFYVETRVEEEEMTFHFRGIESSIRGVRNGIEG